MDNVNEPAPLVDEEKGADVEEQATFTQADIDREADRRVQKALETAKQKMEAEFEAKVKEREDKAAELAKMSAKERQDREMADRIKELEEREKNQSLREYRYTAKAELETAGLPDTFVDMVLSDDVETTKTNIQELAKAFDVALETKVNERLAGSAPKVGGGNPADADPFDTALSRVLG